MDNADLEKLKVSQGKLVPKFKASVTSYSVTVGSNVQEIKLTPLTADGGASFIVKVRIHVYTVIPVRTNRVNAVPVCVAPEH
jgi:hypothetical protein